MNYIFILVPYNKLCSLINSDPSLFTDRNHKEDSVGKLYFDYKDSIKTIRKFKYKGERLGKKK